MGASFWVFISFLLSHEAELHPAIERIIPKPLLNVRTDFRFQVPATIKSTHADSGNAYRYLNKCQIPALAKSPLANAGDACRYCDRCQDGATGKSPPADADNPYRYRDRCQVAVLKSFSPIPTTAFPPIVAGITTSPPFSLYPVITTSPPSGGGQPADGELCPLSRPGDGTDRLTDNVQKVRCRLGEFRLAGRPSLAVWCHATAAPRRVVIGLGYHRQCRYPAVSTG
jgi:hypothetical protein